MSNIQKIKKNKTTRILKPNIKRNKHYIQRLHGQLYLLYIDDIVTPKTHVTLEYSLIQ